MYGDLPALKLENGEEVSGVTVRCPNPPKTAILRLPTPEEMIRRLEDQKSIRRNLGRRKSQTEFVPNPKADLDLFNRIRLDKGADFDEYEAGNAISKLTYCEVTDCDRTGDQYKITLKTPFGVTSHLLNIPIQRDITVYRRSVLASTDLPHGHEELRYRIEPAIALYDSVVAYAEGYSGEVPPHHKSAVAVELVQAVDDLDPALDPNS